MKNQTGFILFLLSAALSLPLFEGCATPSTGRGPAAAETQALPTPNPTAPDTDLTFFSTPEDLHKTWLSEIEKARSSLFMEMFHITDQDIVDALRALPDAVQITLILDSGNLKDPATEKIREQIQDGKKNIQIFPSSGAPKGFVQTHTKSMIVDGKTALITSINLTNNAAIQRDYGLLTHNSAIIGEMTKVFNTDVQNSKNATSGSGPVRDTPEGVGLGKIIWSPVTSESRLASLIASSSTIPTGSDKYLYATVENLGDVAIEKALSSAAKSGVDVRIIVPQCVLGANGPRNYKFFKYLKNGVQYRVMPHPSSAKQPYMHGKMLLLGNGTGYLGSVNYSTNSTQGNRELGMIFNSQTVSQAMRALFDKDWIQSAQVANDADLPNCPTNTGDPSQ
jgi:phosphatidylserine/phosphatidylglycerophosphate/cardiolipin synthase-like enzyme